MTSASPTFATFGEWTFSHQFANLIINQSFVGSSLVFLDSPKLVIEAISSGTADWGLIPYYNRYANSEGVPSSHRMLLSPQVNVHSLREHEINVHLGAPPGSRVEDIHTVLLMPVLQKQCHSFLSRLDSRVTRRTNNIPNTASAMREVADLGPGFAALGTAEAVAEFGLESLSEGVQNPQIVTSFLLLSPEPAPAGGERLVAFEVSDEVDEERVIGQVVEPIFEACEWLPTSTFVLEDRSQPEAGPNHLVMVSASPQEGRPLTPNSPLVLNIWDLGQARP